MARSELVPRSGPRAAAGPRARAAIPLLLIAGAVLAGCDSSPVTPPSERVEVEFLAVEGLQGLPGELLPTPVAVLTSDGSGSPRPGTAVQLRVVDGGGSVEPASASTDATGKLSVRWTLGPADRGSQRLEARVVGSDGGAAATLEAAALGIDETDVVVLRGSTGPLKGLVVLDEDLDGRLLVRQKWARADTVVPLFPVSGGSSLIAVFPTANAPALRETAWTPGIDTVAIDLEGPVRLDLRIHIFAGPFEERRRVAERHLAAAEGVWEAEGVGVALGSVEFVDLTDTESRVELESDGLCERVIARSVIRVDYVHSIDDDGVWGWGCFPSEAYMGLPSADAPRLLAHELGHVFTLPHTSSGLMDTRAVGSTLEEGEIFRVHFDARSAVNAVFEAHPASVQRICGLDGHRRCLPLDFKLGD